MDPVCKASPVTPSFDPFGDRVGDNTHAPPGDGLVYEQSQAQAQAQAQAQTGPTHPNSVLAEATHQIPLALQTPLPLAPETPLPDTVVDSHPDASNSETRKRRRSEENEGNDAAPKKKMTLKPPSRSVYVEDGAQIRLAKVLSTRERAGVKETLVCYYVPLQREPGQAPLSIQADWAVSRAVSLSSEEEWVPQTRIQEQKVGVFSPQQLRGMYFELGELPEGSAKTTCLKSLTAE